jgi:hypothetical protein
MRTNPPGDDSPLPAEHKAIRCSFTQGELDFLSQLPEFREAYEQCSRLGPEAVIHIGQKLLTTHSKDECFSQWGAADVRSSLERLRRPGTARDGE